MTYVSSIPGDRSAWADGTLAAVSATALTTEQRAIVRLRRMASLS
jgi:hypothetical protein